MMERQLYPWELERNREIDALPDFAMPENRACKQCGGRDGKLKESNGQDVIYCADCRIHVYNAPKSETGKPVRRIKSREGLKPGQRTRILERDGAQCLLCKRTDVNLHIAHALSVAQIKEHNIVDIEENDDVNLFACCEECNLDMGDRSIEARIFLHLIAVRLRRGRH